MEQEEFLQSLGAEAVLSPQKWRVTARILTSCLVNVFHISLLVLSEWLPMIPNFLNAQVHTLTTNYYPLSSAHVAHQVIQDCLSLRSISPGYWASKIFSRLFAIFATEHF